MKKYIFLIIILSFGIGGCGGVQEKANSHYTAGIDYNKKKFTLTYYKNGRGIAKYESGMSDTVTSLGSDPKYTNGYLWIEGHVNPSLSIVYIYNLRTEKWRVYRGCFFALNKKNGKMARIVMPPHFGTPLHIKASVFMDDTFLFNVDRNKVKGIYWADDNTVKIVKIKEPKE